MKTSHSYRDQLLNEGFAIMNGVLGSEEIEVLLSSFENLGQSESIRRRGGVFAVRNLLDVSPEVRGLAQCPRVRKIVGSILGPQAFPVRGILFDKTPEANWKVPWHQDLTIAVTSRKELEGFGPWSMKAGVLHVQPPAHVLENMFSIRIHLDPCGEANGALKVIPGSHRLGRIPAVEVFRVVSAFPVTICSVLAGDAVLMRPLVLHSSSASQIPQHRRVIHLDFAGNALPGGLRWAVSETGHVHEPLPH